MLALTSPTTVRQGALDLLLQRMQQTGDFPALSEAIATINQIASSDKESVNKLSGGILKDFALTNKLLKLANTAFYSRVGGGSISTVSRAVVMLGFDTVRSIALSLLLFDSMENRSHAQQLKEEFVKSLFAGMLARDLAAKAQVKDAEEAFICSMFHNLGRTLAMFYFPAEMQETSTLMRSEGYSEAKASAQALGLSFEELGSGVAKNWGFPDAMVFSMAKLPAGKVKKGARNADSLRMLAGFSNELCEIITGTAEADRGKALAQLGGRFGETLHLDERQLTEQMEKSMLDIAQFAAVVGVNLKQSDFAQRASGWVNTASAAGASNGAGGEAVGNESESALAASVLHEPAPAVVPPRTPQAQSASRTPEEIQSILTAGLQDIGNALVDDKSTPDDVVRMILEVMYTGMGFGHVLFCLRNTRHNTLCGKMGFGDGVEELVRAFHFPLLDKPDVFHVALKNNADILITDIDDPKIATRIPGWYRQHVTARTFVILPVLVKGKPVGLFYGDRPQAGDITIAEKELALLKALRNQAVLAIRQRL